jgi:hypothetical protein
MTNALQAIKDLDSTAIRPVKTAGQIRGFSADYANMEEEQAILGNSEMDLTMMGCYADAEPTTQVTVARCGEQWRTQNVKLDIALLDAAFAGLQLQTVTNKVTMEELIYLVQKKSLLELLTKVAVKLMIKKMDFCAIQSAQVVIMESDLYVGAFLQMDGFSVEWEQLIIVKLVLKKSSNKLQK